MAARLTEQSSAIAAWFTLAGLFAATATVIVFLIRTAGIGLRQLKVKPDELTSLLFAGSTWIVLCAPVSAALAFFISATTHHRGLGSTTFAFAGFVIALISGIIAVRLTSLASPLSKKRIAAWTAFAIACALVGAMLLVASRTGSVAPVVLESVSDAALVGDAVGVGGSTNENADSATFGAAALAVADAALLVLLCVAASSIRLPASRLRIWVPATVLVLSGLICCGVSTMDWLAAVPEAPNRILLVSPVLNMIATPDTHPKRLPRFFRNRGFVSTDSTPSIEVNTAITESTDTSGAALDPTATANGRQGLAQPDMIVVTLDTVRADHLGAYRHGADGPAGSSTKGGSISPNLDALAGSSVLFERAYAAGPETRSAIAPLVTCKYLVESARDNRPWPTLLRANETVAERLRAVGYATAAVSSFQWISKARGFDQGFDLFDEAPFRRVSPERDSTGAHAVAQAMAAYDRLSPLDKPLFLWVHMFDAHADYLAHDGFGFGSTNVARYDSEIAYLDNELARFIQHVQKGRRNNKTVWIVHGSHGEAFSEHGFTGHPPIMYDEVVRVPLFVKLDGVAGRRITDAAVSVLDVPATVLDLGMADSTDCSGESLLGLAAGTKSQRKTSVLVLFDGVERQNAAYALIDGRDKYFFSHGGERSAFLFDVVSDPKETTNRLEENSNLASSFRLRLDQYLADHVHVLEAVPE